MRGFRTRLQQWRNEESRQCAGCARVSRQSSCFRHFGIDCSISKDRLSGYRTKVKNSSFTLIRSSGIWDHELQSALMSACVDFQSLWMRFLTPSVAAPILVRLPIPTSPSLQSPIWVRPDPLHPPHCAISSEHQSVRGPSLVPGPPGPCLPGCPTGSAYGRGVCWPRPWGPGWSPESMGLFPYRPMDLPRPPCHSVAGKRGNVSCSVLSIGTVS